MGLQAAAGVARLQSYPSTIISMNLPTTCLGMLPGPLISRCSTTTRMLSRTGL